MEHEDFRRFEQLASTLHFGRSARQLGMSASALTRRVQAMEEALGIALFVRDPRSVRLTVAGERFRSYARDEHERWQKLRNELLGGTRAPMGDLRIACTVTACYTVLPRLLALCRERYPGIALQLVTQDAARSLAQLESGEVDLAVVPTDGPSPGDLCTCILASTDLVFIAPNDPMVRDRLANNRKLQGALWIAQMAGLERKRLDWWLADNDQGARLVAEVRGNEAIIAMVSLGCGLGLVPRLVLTASPLPVFTLDHVKAPPGYDVSLCVRRKGLGRETVQAFWSLAEEGGSLSGVGRNRVKAGRKSHKV
jgi:LysR family positive regulator for ilvC